MSANHRQIARQAQHERLRGATNTSRQTPQLMEAAELERIRCAWRAGLHEPTVGSLLEQLAIRDRAIHTIAARAAQGGTPEQQAAARNAEEMVADRPPIHLRLEFDVPTGHIGHDTVEAFLTGIKEWTVEELASLADVAQATVTYRGESESWETRLP